MGTITLSVTLFPNAQWSWSRMLETSFVSKFIGHVEYVGDGNASGWAWDSQYPERILDIEMFVGDKAVLTSRADMYRDDLAQAGIGTGAHAFFIRSELIGTNKPISFKVRGYDHSLPIEIQRTRSPLSVYEGGEQPNPPDHYHASSRELWGLAAQVAIVWNAPGADTVSFEEQIAALRSALNDRDREISRLTTEIVSLSALVVDLRKKATAK